MTTEKACKNCKFIYVGEKCPNCSSQEYSEEIKGRVIILDTEKSEIAKNLKINKPGSYAIKSS